MYQIAIDGPSGAGKSTVAKLLADKMHIAYLDTGAMYRAVALYVHRRGIDPERPAAVTAVLDHIDINILYVDGKQVTLLNGEDVSVAIRHHEISAMSSAVSANPAVRDKLVRLQRAMASKRSFVLDGRDIGTAVLPAAKYKFYLTAAVDVRARRRMSELQAKGQIVNFDQICEDIRVRDQNDMTRKYSPLKKADNAVEIDTSDMDIDEVVTELSKYLQEDVQEK